MTLFDLDELAAIDGRFRLFSYNRWNLLSFYDCDHLFGSAESLRLEIEHLLDDAGLDFDGGAIRLLCMPRILGYVFNPISVYFCYRRDGSPVAIIYEVNNTFSQRHLYLFAMADDPNRWIGHSCAKQLHVSPFMDMEMSYQFHIHPPRDEMAFNVNARDSAGLLLATGFVGRKAELADRRLLALMFAYPLLTFKVTVAIHFEALRLWLKGVRLRPSPPSLAEQATFITISKE